MKRELIMKKQEFVQLVKKSYIILDGATGSNLMLKGMTSKHCPEQWILQHPDALIELQKKYVDAGSNIVYAPTFTANRIKLEEYGLANDIQRINHELVALSKKAVGNKAYVAGDITMTGKQLAPMGTLDFEELVTVYKEQIGYLVEAGVDLLVVETMMSLQETRAAVIAAKEVCDLPIMATLTFESDRRTLYGTDPKTAAITLEALGVDALGANCSSGPKEMAMIVREMAEVTSVPIIAKPNAGMPKLNSDGTTGYDMSPDEFAKEMVTVLEAGASILGGCCGTNPEYINQIANLVNQKVPVVREKNTHYFLTSERMTVEFGLDDPFVIVGERINPTGKKTLQAELREGSLNIVRKFVEEQEALGAKVLDVNVGMSGIDEKETMLKVMDTVLMETNLPLSLDSSNVTVLEAALRRYPGKALVNSVSLEKHKLSELLPIVKKYGASFILLPLNDEGLPENEAIKRKYIDELVDIAISLGFYKNEIIVDGLVTTIGANKNAAVDTLNTIAECKEKGLATICGLSNISFGLPQRPIINSTFLTMAIKNGLTLAICNPSNVSLTDAAFAADLLLNKPGADLRYIEYMENRVEPVANSGVASQNKPVETIPSALDSVKEEYKELYRCVLKGKKDTILNETKLALENDFIPQEIIENAFMPAINEVGMLFEKGKYFLPQLMASAESMEMAISYLEPFMQNENQEEKECLIAATVEGDIHDIGKNLVVMMLKNHGYKVIDLGKDVKKEEILEAAVRENAKIILLSALMTTTMVRMKEVIAYKNEIAPQIKVMIGGAVITPEYKDEICADGYAKDAQEAVEVAKKLLA